MKDDQRTHSRRSLLKLATGAIGALLGLALAVPGLRFLLAPIGRPAAVAPTEPIDVASIEQIPVGSAPVRVAVMARASRDAWTAQTGNALGSVWLSQQEHGTVRAFSSICPHKECAVEFDRKANEFSCPCHNSAFDVDGRRLRGPSKRDLDPLPVEVKNGRVWVQFMRFRSDTTTREPV